MERNDDAIAPSMLYAWAAIMEGVPFANGAPNLTVDTPALIQLANGPRRADLRQGFQDRPDVDEDRHCAGPQGANARTRRLVLDEHPRQPRWRGARRPGVVQDEGGVKALACCTRFCSPRSIPTCTTKFSHVVRINYYPPRGDNKEGLGQHRHRRVDGLPDADQDQLPLSRFDSRGADRSRSRAVLGLRAPGGHEGDSGMAIVLLQEPDGRTRDYSRSTICSFSRRSSRTRCGT